jgi:hypothetical protein
MAPGRHRHTMTQVRAAPAGVPRSGMLRPARSLARSWRGRVPSGAVPLAIRDGASAGNVKRRVES